MKQLPELPKSQMPEVPNSRRWIRVHLPLSVYQRFPVQKPVARVCLRVVDRVGRHKDNILVLKKGIMIDECNKFWQEHPDFGHCDIFPSSVFNKLNDFIFDFMLFPVQNSGGTYTVWCPRSGRFHQAVQNAGGIYQTQNAKHKIQRKPKQTNN